MNQFIDYSRNIIKDCQDLPQIAHFQQAPNFNIFPQIRQFSCNKLSSYQDKLNSLEERKRVKPDVIALATEFQRKLAIIYGINNNRQPVIQTIFLHLPSRLQRRRVIQRRGRRGPSRSGSCNSMAAHHK